MIFVFIDKDNIETEILLDILKSENVGYSIKKHCYGFSENYCDIKINTTYEKYEFINYIFNKKIKPYQIAENSYDMEDYIENNAKDNLSENESFITTGEATADIEKIRQVLSMFPPPPFTELNSTISIVRIPKISIKPYKKKQTIADIMKKWLKGED